MNGQLFFVLGLAMIALALLAFIMMFLIPAKEEKGVLFSGWLIADGDGYIYVCTERPNRKTWTDSNGDEHGMWWHDTATFLEIGDAFPSSSSARAEFIPTWADEPIRVELVAKRDIDDVPMEPEAMDDGMCDVV